MICHGYPNAHAHNRIAVHVFYYYGAWGSEGTYRFANLTPSTVEAVDYLKSLEFVDPDRVGLVSHIIGAVPLTNVMSKARAY
ncbi:hypothetical protein ACFL0D_07520 [Thermoproteota archaeon]